MRTTKLPPTPEWVPPAAVIEYLRREQLEREARRPRLEIQLPLPGWRPARKP